MPFSYKKSLSDTFQKKLSKNSIKAEIIQAMKEIESKEIHNLFTLSGKYVHVSGRIEILYQYDKEKFTIKYDDFNILD